MTMVVQILAIGCPDNVLGAIRKVATALPARVTEKQDDLDVAAIDVLIVGVRIFSPWEVVQAVTKQNPKVRVIVLGAEGNLPRLREERMFSPCIPRASELHGASAWLPHQIAPVVAGVLRSRALQGAARG